MNALFGRYLRTKTHDSMLIFLFAKTRGNSLIQSTNIFLWSTFTLHSIKYAILHWFWAFFENITPCTATNISKSVVSFKSCCNTSNWIACWFADLFMRAKVWKTAQKSLFCLFFWQDRPPKNQFFTKMPNLLSFTSYYYICKVSCQTN